MEEEQVCVWPGERWSKELSNETQAPDCVSAQISEFILREPKFPVFGLSLLKNLIWDLLSLKLNLGVPERGLVNKDVTLLC